MTVFSTPPSWRRCEKPVVLGLVVARTPNPNTPPQGGGQIVERIKSLDKNGDGRITKEEAGGAAWFDRADQNNDGVLDAAELETLRRGTGVRRGAINR